MLISCNFDKKSRQQWILGDLRKNLKAFKKGGDGTHNARYRNEFKNKLIFKIRCHLRLRPQF